MIQDPQDAPTGQQAQQEKLRVCETCSAFLSMYDSNRRLADHFGGKLHIGYLQIRDRLKELKEKYPSGSNRGVYGRDSREREYGRDDYRRSSPTKDSYYRRDSGDRYDRRYRDSRDRGSRDRGSRDRGSRDREYRRDYDRRDRSPRRNY